jgi:transcriptional regulator with XRE-family HTH domain
VQAQGNQAVIIGDRLRTFRKGKNLTQKDVAQKTGLLRCNVGRLENGKAVPTITTLEKIVRALEIPMSHLFYDYEKSSTKYSSLPKLKSTKGKVWGSSGKDARMLAQFCQLFSCMSASDMRLILFLAEEMSRRKVV